MKPLRAAVRKEHYLRRQRQLAQTVSRRAYRPADGRLLLVGGKPDPARMLGHLSHLGDGHGHVVTPFDWGFHGGDVEEASTARLSIAGRALTKWKHRLVQRSGRRNGELKEVQQLSKRLSTLHDWRRLATSDKLGRAVWLLDAEQERELESVTKCCLTAPQSSQIVSFARLVLWLSGRVALERFCSAISHLPATTPEIDARQLLRASLAKLEIWIKRAKYDHYKQIRWEARDWISRLPPRIVARAGLSSKLRRDTLFSQLQEQRDRCAIALRECSDGGRPTLIAAIATIAACDGSSLPIPVELILHWAGQNDQKQFVRSCLALLDQSKERGYNRLLDWLNESPETSYRDLEFLRLQLDRGASKEDIEWVLHEDLRYCFKKGSLRPSWARQLQLELSAAGIEIDSSDLWDLLSAIETEVQRQAIDNFVSWTDSLPAVARTPRLCRLLKSVLLGPFRTAVGKLQLFKELKQWKKLVKRSAFPSVSSDVDAWERQLSRIAEAIGRPLHSRDKTSFSTFVTKRSAELHYLKDVADKGVATPSQTARMQYLQLEFAGNCKCRLSRQLHSIQKSYVTMSIEALLHQIRAAAAAMLGPALASRLVDCKLSRILQFAGWVREMSSAEKQLLEDILFAHRQYGEDYKRHLPCNRRWLYEIDRPYVALEHWLRPPSWKGNVSGTELTIAASTDPVETFLMGNYFGTCLSLGDSNQMSVLANAADANKQVLFVRDRSGKVIARKLIALSEDGGMLGYCCYVNDDNSGDSIKDAVTGAMTEYCFRLAHRCCVGLVDEGEPTSIEGHFWYDDDPQAWDRPKTTPEIVIPQLIANTEFYCYAAC